VHVDDLIEAPAPMMAPVLTATLLATFGLLAWMGISIWGGVSAMGPGQPFQLREAWDIGSYFWLALPAMMLAAGVAGYLVPERVWRWPAWLMAGHLVGIVLVGVARGSGLGLLPFAIVLLALLVLLFWLPALLGKALAKMGERAR
jgi:hypothetical protein